MDITQLKREVTWYTDEIEARRRDLERARGNVVELENKITEAKRQLALYKQELTAVETEQKNKPQSSTSY